MASTSKPKKTISDTGLDKRIQTKIYHSKILVVGAGGIGCELLKNLVLTGFKDIEIIDLDTIDISNLNRQFLFQKKHVKMSKAKVARETALKFNPKASVKAYHDSIISPEYGVNFFKKFKLVLNALDNRAARNHVNRLCLAAEVPLVESGTAGYDGQVELIFKGLTKCYECDPKPPQKSFPGCTIRNTPSEPIHCIVWAKHLFNQLFGEDDPDQDVSPDTADPEAAANAGDEALKSDENIKRMSTRLWAQSCDYDIERLFKKFFHDDIKYLLSMNNLWKKRRPPTPLEWDKLPTGNPGTDDFTWDILESYCRSFSRIQESSQLPRGNQHNAPDKFNKKSLVTGMKDQRQWTLTECVKIFGDSCKGLKQQLEALKEDDHIVWDKDDCHAMDFVTSCANIRAFIFGIPLHSKFTIKSMAGNIIPAIATTNAVIAGVVVLHAINILSAQLGKCQTVYVRYKPNHRGLIVVPEKSLIGPNPKCYVCASKPKVVLYANINKMLVKELEENVLKKTLNMVAPDVCIDDGTGTIIISSEEGETEEYSNKYLSQARIFNGSILSVDDFLQDYNLSVEVVHKEEFAEGTLFKVCQGANVMPPKKIDEATNGEKKENTKENDGEDDDLVMMDSDDYIEMVVNYDTSGYLSPTETDLSHTETDLSPTETDLSPTETDLSPAATDLSPTSKKRKLENEAVPVKKRRTNNESVEVGSEDVPK